MANNQFPMYRVIPAPAFRQLTPKPGMSAKQLSQLTTYMREVLYDAMGEAITDAAQFSSIKSRKGRIWSSFKSGRRQTGYRSPSTVSVTFMARPWMAIHETGGTIKPRSRKYLALPMPDALRKDGGMKRRNPAGWKSYGSFVYTAKSGKKFLVYRSKTQDRLVFLYYLATKVEMNKRMSLYDAIMGKENEVVSLWSYGVMDIFNSVDLYGIAFEGIRVE